MGKIVDYNHFVKVASLVTDTDAMSEEAKLASYLTYTKNPDIRTEILKVARDQSTNQVEKRAYEMLIAAKAYDNDLLIDYGENNDIAKHAGLAKWYQENNLSSGIDKSAGLLWSGAKAIGTTGFKAGTSTLGIAGISAASSAYSNGTSKANSTINKAVNKAGNLSNRGLAQPAQVVG